MTKKELAAEIAALRAEVARLGSEVVMLRSREVQQPRPNPAWPGYSLKGGSISARAMESQGRTWNGHIPLWVIDLRYDAGLEVHAGS